MIHVMPNQTIQLTADQIDFFHREGYLTIDELTTQEDVAAIREIYDHLFETRAGRDEGRHFDLAGTDEDGREETLPQILGPHRYAPQLEKTLLLANAMAVANQLLGPEATCQFAHAIFKPPRIGAATPWHQDAAYWEPAVIHRKASIWVPLQPATPENGCMQFVPRSHQSDVIPHQSIHNDPRIHGLELPATEMHRVDGVVTCPLAPGGATVHDGYTLHYTAANRTNVPRRAIILSASAGATPRSKPRRFPWMESKQTARMARQAEARDHASPQD